MENQHPADSGNISLDKSDYRKPQRRPDPVWAVVWRFLLICAVIDGGAYYYFHVVKNTTVFEGLARLRDSIHQERGADAPPPPPVKTQIITTKPVGTPTGSEYAKAERAGYFKPIVPTRQSASSPETIYCWEDVDGKRFYSNVGYPKTGYYKAIHTR
ncbi:MAG: hypothetical protein OEL83_14500 [Desulforhopalus sp.]|nr:hypothetical protein [Desulforhopalus sp.]